jgi:hypothetical protein
MSNNIGGEEQDKFPAANYEIWIFDIMRAT